MECPDGWKPTMFQLLDEAAGDSGTWGYEFVESLYNLSEHDCEFDPSDEQIAKLKAIWHKVFA